MSYTSDNRTALNIARCSRGRNRNVSWLSVSYVALVTAVTFLVGLAADAISVDVLVEELFTLAAVDFFVHNFYLAFT